MKKFISAAHERLMDVYERLEDLDASKAQVKAAYILHGLGFTRTMQHTKVSENWLFIYKIIMLEEENLSITEFFWENYE